MTPMWRARIDAGWVTQQQLADRVLVSRQTISAIETWRSIPSVTLALAIARELDTTVELLWGQPPHRG